MKLTGIIPILNVSDVPASLAWFEQLGWERCWTYNQAGPIDDAADANDAGPANFGAVASGECEIFLCRDGQGSRGGPMPRHVRDDDTGGVWMSWWVAATTEVDAAHALALQHGMMVTRPPTDEPWGVREFHLRHPDGHTFRVSAPICGE
jgi:catechol 2,3-dioxygenase-like lactoylglutathione lyase family enzyme